MSNWHYITHSAYICICLVPNTLSPHVRINQRIDKYSCSLLIDPLVLFRSYICYNFTNFLRHPALLVNVLHYYNLGTHSKVTAVIICALHKLNSQQK